MERHVDLSSLSVRTEVSDWLMYHACVISFLNHLMLVLLNLYYLQFVTGLSFLKILLFYTVYQPFVTTCGITLRKIGC